MIFTSSENFIVRRQLPSNIVLWDMDHSKIKMDHSKNEIFRFLWIFKFWRILMIIAMSITSIEFVKLVECDISYNFGFFKLF